MSKFELNDITFRIDEDFVSFYIEDGNIVLDVLQTNCSVSISDLDEMVKLIKTIV